MKLMEDVGSKMHWVVALAKSIGPSSREDARLLHSAHLANMAAQAANVGEPAANTVRRYRQTQTLLIGFFPLSRLAGIVCEFSLCPVQCVLHL